MEINSRLAGGGGGEGVQPASQTDHETEIKTTEEVVKIVKTRPGERTAAA